ncbi:MAG: glycosyltransferase [Clostridia bacterium]|nr:glycosyltransferase [Clostridia bacterium]
MISVIVPIYNVEKYLRKGIESIINQTYTDLEIVLVNDGSKDTCLDICKEYAENDSRIKIVDKPNGGLVSAWKAGVAVANGDYIGFVDPDDYIDEDYYQKLYETIQSNNADLAVCGEIKEDEQGNFLSTDKASDIVSAGLYEGEKFEILKQEYYKNHFLINSGEPNLSKKSW